VAIGITETIESQDPYADSVALLYGIWCEVLGCLVTYDFDKNDYAPSLAESWDVENPTTWVFHLRQDVTWHDGSPFTSADVVYSFDRIQNDPASRQRRIFSVVKDVDAPDDYTVRVTTRAPTASLLDYFADRLIVTNKAQYDQYGDAVWEQPPLGTGPYMFKDLVPNQRLVIVKNPHWWGGPVNGPDEVVYRVMREPEVRVTALLNGELQMAEFIPPHMADRVTGQPNTKIASYDSLELMFLAMSPKFKPWDNKLVRQAVAYAVDRDAIIQGLLQGQARKLDGPVGPGQYAYTPDLQPKYAYDPDKARQLLAQAGYANGVDVELSTPVGRYIQDKQISEAIAQMLTAVGIRTTLLTPEWPTLWSNVQDGKVPFYYMGRGSVVDPGPPLSQYFETGVSPRVGYSNPQVDALFAKSRAAFDPTERKRALAQLMSMLTEEAPADFLWRHKMLMGLAKNVEYQPRPDDRIYAQNIRVK
jgi:peptide/nickel transport system substrate-binding protein